MIHGGDIYRHHTELDFSVNLNPLGIPARVSEALRSGLDMAGVYPDPIQSEVRKRLAEFEGVNVDNVLAGAGASELIMGIVRSICPHAAILMEPGFNGYRHALYSIGDCDIIALYATADRGYVYDLSDVTAKELKKADLIFVQDPINPVGRNIDRKALTKLLNRAAECGTSVVLDESFYLMSEAGMTDTASASGLISNYPGLYIIRSFTKSCAIPGVRIGYLLSSEGNIAGVRSQLPEWNLGAVQAACVPACIEYLSDKAAMSSLSDHIRAERLYLCDALGELGFKVYGSDTVFIMFEAPTDLYGKLLDRHILIRELGTHPGLGPGVYRIAVRDHGSNERLIREIRDIIYED